MTSSFATTSEQQVNASALVHFTVVNNIIYSKNMGKYGGFQKNINEILTSLQKKVVLPDVEFLFNMGDWPQSPKKGGYNGAPEDLYGTVCLCACMHFYSPSISLSRWLAVSY